MIGVIVQWSAESDCQQKSKKKPDPPSQEAHVVTGGAEDGVDRVTVSPCEVVSFEMAILLEVADHGFDPTASAHFSADSW